MECFEHGIYLNERDLAGIVRAQVLVEPVEGLVTVPQRCVGRGDPITNEPSRRFGVPF